MYIQNQREQGLILYLSVVIISIILAVLLGTTALLVSQLKTLKALGLSTLAFYAASTGGEVVLSDIKGGTYPSPSYNGLLNGAEYTVEVTCCHSSDPDCQLVDPDTGDSTCPGGLSMSYDCEARKYCIYSTGEYKEIRRAVEILY